MEENKVLKSNPQPSWPKYNETYLEEQYFTAHASDCRRKNYDLDSFINKYEAYTLDKPPIIDIKVSRGHEVIAKIGWKSE